MAEPIRAFTSRVIPLPNENVDTDQIIPARYLKTTGKEGLAEGLFFNWRYLADGTPNPDFVLNRPAMAGRQILLAGDNFGPGSSREHAPWALLAWGIRAVISTRFADIFRGNALKNGLLPVTVNVEGQRRLFDLVASDPDAELTVDLEEQRVRLPGGEEIAFGIDAFARQMLLAGLDEIGYVMEKLPEIQAFEGARPSPVDTLA